MIFIHNESKTERTGSTNLRKQFENFMLTNHQVKVEITTIEMGIS